MSKLSTDTTDRTSKQALVGSSVLLLDLIAVTRACRVAVTKVAACYALAPDATPPHRIFSRADWQAKSALVSSAHRSV
jgi:hypothetical protein